MTNEYHFIGIKGSGMSALAGALHDLGHQVQGEDVEQYIFTEEAIKQRRIPIYSFGSAPLNARKKVIVSNAFAADHASIQRCQEQGLIVQRYHEFLGEWMTQYTTVAVTGSHGKTTTTGLMAHVMQGIEPACGLIGDGTGFGTPGARYFVFESCEYRRHFLAYRPDFAIITNIDYDHPDYFSDLDDVQHAFEQMCEQVKQQIVACGDDPQVQRLKTERKLLRYGLEASNDLRAEGLRARREGLEFDVSYRDTVLDRFFIPMHGKHNVLNALAVIGTGLLMDLNMEEIKQRLATFKGVKRRFSERDWRGNVVIDDYAHHPNEIRATLEAVRSKYPNKTVVGIFQPHTFSRMEKMMAEFAVSLKDADQVYLCDIFASAREHAGTVSVEQLRDRIPNAQLFNEQTISALSSYDDSVLVFMGAGDIQKYQSLLDESV